MPLFKLNVSDFTVHLALYYFSTNSPLEVTLNFYFHVLQKHSFFNRSNLDDLDMT